MRPLLPSNVVPVAFVINRWFTTFADVLERWLDLRSVIIFSLKKQSGDFGSLRLGSMTLPLLKTSDILWGSRRTSIVPPWCWGYLAPTVTQLQVFIKSSWKCLHIVFFTLGNKGGGGLGNRCIGRGCAENVLRAMCFEILWSIEMDYHIDVMSLLTCNGALPHLFPEVRHSFLADVGILLLNWNSGHIIS